MADNLKICDRCGSDACYVQEVNNEITNYQCYGCGFITNTLLKKDTQFFDEQMELLPNLYKELMGEDDDGKTKDEDSSMNKLFITNDSTSLKKELMGYSYRINKGTGQITNEPIDFNNHLIDAARYASMMKLSNKATAAGKYVISVR